MIAKALESWQGCFQVGGKTMTKKIFIAIWRGEGAHDFGILGRPSEKEEDVYETIAYDIIAGKGDIEEGTEEFDERVEELSKILLGDSEVDGRNYGYECDYNIESFEMEFEND